MQTIVSRTLSVHKEHELLLKLEAAGLTDDLAQRVINSKGNDLAAKVVRLISNGGFEATTTQKLAREIMGKNFFGVEEAIRHFGVKPTLAQLSALAEIPFTEAELREYKNSHIMVAVFPMSILDIRGRVERQLFYSHKDAWYNNEAFVLNPIFEPTFIANSFSCRIGKGNHRGVKVLEKMLRRVSGNFTKPCFALKCDIKKFFDTVDHDLLLNIIRRRVKDEQALWLLREVIESYYASRSCERERESKSAGRAQGLPIGNLTSQLFANIYLNEFDYFIKHILKVKFYARYTDDFVIVSDNRPYLLDVLPSIKFFLRYKLLLELHPNKVFIRAFHQGIDFLGYILRPHHRLVRTKTRQRIFRKLFTKVKEFKNGLVKEKTLEQSLQSYLGVLSHANTHKLAGELKNKFWFWLTE